MKKILPAASLLAIAFSVGVGSGPAAAPDSGPGFDLGSLPLAFVANRGQAAAPVLFYARTPGHAVWLTRTALVFDSHEAALPAEGRQASREVTRLEFLGAAENPAVLPQGPTGGTAHFLRGGDPAGWTTGVGTSSAVLYQGLYKGIDLKVYGAGRTVEYDWIVNPGGSVEDIAFRISGAAAPDLDRDGNLVVRSRHGEWMHRRPRAHQDIDGTRVDVASEFRALASGAFGLKVGAYDASRPLTIDPIITLRYSTFLGGTGDDVANAVAVSAGGSVYLAGSTSSADFPVKSGFSLEPSAKSDAFITKLTADGERLVYSTYIGGAGDDEALGIAVNNGVAFVAGTTDSTDFPVKNALQGKIGGGRDAFVLRLHANGAALDYATFLGGEGADEGRGIAVDSQGNAYVAGRTASTGFPLLVPLDAKNEGGEAFVAKIGPRGASLLYSTFLGGSAEDGASAIAVDGRGVAYVAGSTSSPDFPVIKAYDNSYNGEGDAFVAAVAESGRALLYATYLGGTAADAASAIALGASGEAFVTGQTASADFPLRSAYDSVLGGKDAFVTRLSATGRTLGYSTFLGGAGEDAGLGIVVDAKGGAVVAGYTTSPDFPYLAGFDSNYGLGRDAFVTKLAPNGKTIAFSTYLGANKNETALALARDGEGYLYVAGVTTSPRFPVRGGFDLTANGLQDAFLVKFADGEMRIAAAALRYDMYQTLLPLGLDIIGSNLGDGQGAKMVLMDGAIVPPELTVGWNNERISLDSSGWTGFPVYWDRVYTFAVREGSEILSNLHRQRFLIPIFNGLVVNIGLSALVVVVGDGFGFAPGPNVLRVGAETVSPMLWTNNYIIGSIPSPAPGSTPVAFIQRGSDIISWQTPLLYIIAP